MGRKVFFTSRYAPLTNAAAGRSEYAEPQRLPFSPIALAPDPLASHPMCRPTSLSEKAESSSAKASKHRRALGVDHLTQKVANHQETATVTNPSEWRHLQFGCPHKQWSGRVSGLAHHAAIPQPDHQTPSSSDRSRLLAGFDRIACGIDGR